MSLRLIPRQRPEPEACETPDSGAGDVPNARTNGRLVGMPPIVGVGARVLVLGSMPGAESLRRREYYGHPRNHFWRIVQDVFLVPGERPYAERVQALQDVGVAVWDVLASCHRQGSLDARIDPASMRVNDVPGLVARLPRLKQVLLNGTLAEKVYRAHLHEQVQAVRPLSALRLPSSSPANASWRYEDKLLAWRAALLPNFAPSH